jgi:hypothetical protein
MPRSASSWAGEGSISPALRSWPEPEVGSHGVGDALWLLVAAFALGLGGVAQVGGVQARAGEVRRVGRGLCVDLVGEGLADGVEHEDRVDDPDAGGEVGAALVHVGVAAGAGAVAQRAVRRAAPRATSAPVWTICPRKQSAFAASSTVFLTFQ